MNGHTNTGPIGRLTHACTGIPHLQINTANACIVYTCTDMCNQTVVQISVIQVDIQILFFILYIHLCWSRDHAGLSDYNYDSNNNNINMACKHSTYMLTYM